MASLNTKEYLPLFALSGRGSSVASLPFYKDYIEEATTQLSDTNTYKPLEEDPTDKFNAVIKNYLKDYGLNQ
ncbi:hypothetical protein J6590_093762, partial [Homalodisca vitripennis]